MKKGFYHFLCLLLACVQTPFAIAMLFGTLAAFLTESNSPGQMLAVPFVAVLFSIPIAAIDRKLRQLDESGTNIFVELGVSMLAAPVRLFLEIATLVKMQGKGEDFGARGKFCKFSAKHALYYAAWNHQSEESKTEQHRMDETVRQAGERAKAAADAEIEARVRFVDGLKRPDNKQNLLILPVVRYHITSEQDEFVPFSASRYDDYTSFSMTEIYINGRRINAVPEITPITLSVKPGVYDIKVVAHYKTFCDMDWKSENTHYKDERPLNKTHTFEYKGLYISENAPVRLVLAAQFVTKYKKEYYVRNGKPTGEKLWTYLGWEHKFYDATVMTPEQIAGFTSIPYVDARDYKHFDPRVSDIATVKRMAERY